MRSPGRRGENRPEFAVGSFEQLGASVKGKAPPWTPARRQTGYGHQGPSEVTPPAVFVSTYTDINVVWPDARTVKITFAARWAKS